MRSRLIVVLILACAGLPSCGVLTLRHEAREFYEATVLAGRVSNPENVHAGVIVAAIDVDSTQPQIAHHVYLHERGGYELIVPDGRYAIVAASDADHDGRGDRDGRVAHVSEPIEVAGTGLIPLLDLTLQASPSPYAAVLQSLPAKRHSTQVGAIADLHSPIFSVDSGRAGYWKPMSSFREVGGNVWFLEPYDPARIPVLLVHGALGSAQDWSAFTHGLDRSRYQLWFFQYPSGAALESMSHLLYWKLLNLQIRYGFERLHIVAHSMGGLVVRRFLLDHGANFPQVQRFVSISTPWAGEPTATLGVEHSPAVVPSWRDMTPGGPFLRTLFARPLPAHVTHDLLFSHRGGYDLLRPNSDGTVTLASQLRPEAQATARSMLGFDEDHTSILRSPQAVAYVAGKLDAQLAASGRMHVQLKVPEQHVVSGTPMLVLTPLSIGAQPIFMPLSLSTMEQLPIAAGTYDVSFAAPGFVAAPRIQRVEIQPDVTHTVRFDLSAQGMLLGEVVAAVDPVRQPAGSLRKAENSAPIVELILEGPSGMRRIAPAAPLPSASTLDEIDYAIQGRFQFARLSEGRHRLTVIAAGVPPHISEHDVRLGTLTLLRPIVLATK